MTEYLNREYLFGSYPQAPVTDRALRGRLAELGGDSAGWEELNPKRLFRDLTVSGERYRGLTGGGVPQWFRFAPVRWRAVGRESRSLFLRAVHILDAQVFNRAVIRSRTENGLVWYSCPFTGSRGHLEEIAADLSDAGVPPANCFAGSCLDSWLQVSFRKAAFSDALALIPADGSAAIPCRTESLMIEGPQTRRFPAARIGETVCLTPYAAAAGCESPHCWYADGNEAPEGEGIRMSGDPCEIAGVQPVLQVYLF